MAINPDFYARNAGRPYPLDDAASAVDDAGAALPPGLLVDCSLRFPDTLGPYAFLAALTVSPRLVTAVFAAAAAPATAGPAAPAFAPLAAVSVAAPAAPGRPYAVSPLADGVGGWAVFGPDAAAGVAYSGRFAGPAAAMILPRCARPYRVPPVASIGRDGDAAALTGVARLLGGGDVEVAQEPRTIDGRTVEAIVIRLVPSPARNTLQAYAGPGAQRPESGTCARPCVRRIGGAVPDCDGDVRLVFRHLIARPYHDLTGVTLDAVCGLAASCAAARARAVEAAAAGADRCV